MRDRLPSASNGLANVLMLAGFVLLIAGGLSAYPAVRNTLGLVGTPEGYDDGHDARHAFGYTSMNGMTGDTTRMATLEQMPDTPGLTNEPLFYAGLAMLLGSFGLSWWRQRRNVCQPLHLLRTLRAALDRRA